MGYKQKILLSLQKFISQCVYSAFSFLFSRSTRTITFVSNRSGKLEGNLLAVYDELKKRDLLVTLRILTKKYDNSLKGKWLYLCFFIEFYYILATSKVVLIDDYLLPLYLIRKKKNTIVIQLWHAAGAFKKFGYSALNKKFGPSEDYTKMVPIHSNYDYALISSESVAPHFAEAFNMNQNQLLPYGLPRTDVLFHQDFLEDTKKRAYKRFPEFRDKKLLLYAPTFRGASHSQHTDGIYLDVERLYRILGDDYFLIIHLHPYLSDKNTIPAHLKHFAGVYNGRLSITESMIISKLLITDYSSVIFEYSLLQKPMCFFVPDLEAYKDERDFYFDYETFIPGPMFSNTRDMGLWIKNESYDKEKSQAFGKLYFDDHDGAASARIVEKIMADFI